MRSKYPESKHFLARNMAGSKFQIQFKVPRGNAKKHLKFSKILSDFMSLFKYLKMHHCALNKHHYLEGNAHKIITNKCVCVLYVYIMEDGAVDTLLQPMGSTRRHTLMNLINATLF